VSSWTRPWGEDSGPFGCPQHPSVQASARVKAPLAQAQWKRPNQRFPQGQAGQRQKTSRNLPRSHAWRNSRRRGITALTVVSVQSPPLSRPINRSHHGCIACAFAFASFAFLSGPAAFREDPHHHRLRPERPGQGAAADWTARRAGAQTAVAVRDDARAPTRASTAAAAAEGDRAADVPTGRFAPPPPLRFDPLLSIAPRRLAEINAGAPGGSRETRTVVHPSQRRRVELSRFAPYLLSSSGVRIEPMAPPPLPSCLHRPHLRRRLLPLQGASRSFLPPPPSR
jgi:hypothetical protein